MSKISEADYPPSTRAAGAEDATRLSETMTFDEYLEAVLADEQWVQDLHGKAARLTA